MMASSIQENFNMGTICDALGRVETKWFKIGVRLGIPRHVLKQFKRDEEDPLSAVVECCLQGNATEATKPFSWPSIVEALKSDYVGEPGLAEEISKKYCQPEENEVAKSTATESESPELKQEPTESNSNETVRDKPQLMEKSSFQEASTVENAIEAAESLAGAGAETEKAEHTSQQENSNASKASNSPEVPREPLDPKVKKDLEFILEKNVKEIIRKYGLYVDTLREIIEEKGVSPEALQTFLMTLLATSQTYKGQKLALLSDKKTELEKRTTVTAIFSFLITECASFLNYEVFQSILERYKVEPQEILNYQEHLKDYIKKHKISEFVKINPLLKKRHGSIELILKFDIETTQNLAKISDLTKVIAEILDLTPSTLQIVGIEDGCVVVTFLIPPSVAEVIFTPNTVFTPQQQDKLRAASVIWIKCNGHTFNFEVRSKTTNAVALKKVEEQLQCSVCLGRYTDPKLLQCLHTYCQQCLQGLVQQDQQKQLTLPCPTCRQVTPVPASGVAGLQADFRANQLLEIVGEEWKEGTTAKIPQVARPEEVPSPSSAILTQCEHTTVFCPQHDGKVTELYCETCEEAICMKCTIKGGKHQGHSYDELETAIQTSLTMAEQALLAINEAVANLDSRCDEISNQRVTIEEEIRNTDIVDVRKTGFISQLHHLTQAKLKSLAAQRDQIETIQAQLNRHLYTMKETCHHPKAMLRKITVVRQVKELTTSIQPGMLEPDTEADMKFYASISDRTTDSPSYGLVIAGSLPFKCHITKIVTPISPKFTAFLETVDSYNQPLKVSMDSIRCELVSEQTGTRLEASVERRGESQYQISYQPTIKGRHQLHIKVEGQPIRGSPFSVSAWSPVVEVVGTPIPILTISGVKVLYGVAVNKKGEVVVAEKDGHCVVVFSPSGERFRLFGTYGSGQGQFKNPEGVAIDGEENILVADTDNHRIQKFTAQGKFLTAVGTDGTGSLQFNKPCGIAYNSSNGRMYVSDTWNHRIQILSPDLSYLDTFGEYGSGMGQFDNPQHVACDSTGNVHVADHNNHRIQVFTPEGKFLRIFGMWGEGRGELKWPFGIAIDSSDRVYVSEWGNDRVSVFTSEGQFVTSFSRWGKGPGEFIYPSGIAVDSSGVVYVCDYYNNRIQLF